MISVKRAAIDIGSNSILILIAEVGGEEVEVLEERFFAPRLSAGLDADARLSEEAMDRAAEDLRKALAICSEYGAEDIRAGATAAVREAVNGADFTTRIKAELGLTIRILSGEEEAELTYLGGVFGKDVHGPAALLDVGGASSEVIVGQDSCPTEVVSVSIGAVRFAERFGRSPGSDKAAVQWLEEKLRPPALMTRGRRLLGVGGTITTLAAVELGMRKYDAGQINEVVLGAERIDATIEHFRSLDIEELARLPGMEPGRSDIIEAGATIVRAFMRHSGADRIEVSARGLRYGLLLAASV